jgi:peptidyl-prolyl cis-trans isomerase D
MFDFVYKKKRLVQLVLALITLPFAFFGIDYYFRGTDTVNEVASVSGSKISQNEFAETLRDQQDRMRAQLGANFDPAMFDDPQVRYSVLEQIIGQRLLDNQARKANFRVTDGQLVQYIGELPPFQEEGKFSRARYEQMLASQNMTPLMFEQRVRQELTLGPLQEPVSGSNIVAKSNAERYVGLLDQQREVATATIGAESFAKDVKVDDAAVKAFYDANQAAFQEPEQVKIEYVSLTPDALMDQVKVDAAEIRKQYDDNLKQYIKPEERSASHILIAVKPDAKDDEKAAAKQKAETLAAAARKNPGQFAELAKSNSQDPGSAAQGGDLGSFAKDGSMVKPFEDAVFAAKQGDIVGPVQTDFGWHIIKVTAVKPSQTQTFDETKAQIERDLKRQKAAKKFAESADQFQNLVYEQADSLAPVAKALNLQVQTSPLMPRAQVQALAQNNAKFAQAVFSPESLQAKRNTEAIEVAPGTLMAARVIEYKPATPRSFDDVKAEIKRQLERNAETELAQKAGKDKLALLEQGKDGGLTFGKSTMLTRNQAQPGVTPDALIRIFQVNPAKLPAYVGTASESGGFSIYKVVKVINPAAADATRLTQVSGRMSDQIGREMFNAYLASLKAKADVKINQANLEKK